MISFHCSLALLALIAALILPCCAEGMNAAEKMMWSTYPVATPKGAATGFIIRRHHSIFQKKRELVMITSNHVLETLGGGPLLLVLRSGRVGSKVAPLFLLIMPPTEEAKSFYVTHPLHDISAFKLYLPPEVEEIAETKSFVDEDMLNDQVTPLHTGMEVGFLGYPDVLPGTEGGFPVLRSGRVASYPVEGECSGGRFLINSDVYAGDSGAPVIWIRHARRPKLVGMVIQRVGPEARSFSHLAVAVNAEVIRQTLQMLADRESHPVRTKDQNLPMLTPSTQNSR